MPKKNRRGKRSGRGPYQQPRKDYNTTLLKEILEIQTLEAKGTLPAVRDIEIPRIDHAKIHNVSQKISLSSLTSSSTLGVAGGYQFSLTQLSDVASWTAVFDQFRITYVQVEFIPLSIGGNTTTVSSPFFTAIDYDDASAPTALGEVLQYDTVMTTTPGQPHVRRIRPRVSNALYNGTTFTGYGVGAVGQWVDSASSSVPYYGLKYFWPSSGLAGVVYNVFATFYVQFRNPN